MRITMNMRNETLAMEDAIESRERECVFYVYERERQRELNFPRRRSDFRVLCL